MKNNELIKVNNNIFTKIKDWIKRLKQKFTYKKNVKIDVEEIEEKHNNCNNEIIINAKDAYQKYVLNSDYKLGENIYKTIRERLNINKDAIEKLIEINRDAITYREIIELLDKEEQNLQEYKKTNIMTQIDSKFIFSQYQVPVGIIAIKTNNSHIAIQNIFKAVCTRNAIIVIEKEYNDKSIENLILLIVQECLKKFNVDENIIQIINNDAVNENDLNEFDIIISEDGKTIDRAETDKMYIYEEDEYFADIIQDELKGLELNGKSVEIIKGKMEDCIEKINKDKTFGVCIYTQDRKKAYRFINLVKSENVFFNGTLLNAKKTKKINNIYLTLKNLVYEHGVI